MLHNVTALHSPVIHKVKLFDDVMTVNIIGTFMPLI